MGGMRVVVESACDEDIEIGVPSFAGGGHEIGPGDGSELGTDENGGAHLGAVMLQAVALGADEVAGPGSD